MKVICTLLLVLICCTNIFAQQEDYQTLRDKAEEFRKEGNYEKATSHAVKAVALAEKKVGKEHADYVAALNALATVYQEQGLYTEAEPLLTEVKQIRLKTVGKAHPDYVTSLDNLATLYYYKGVYDQSAALLTEVKEIRFTTLGSEHPDYLTSLENLAAVYQEQGLYPKAELLWIEVKDTRLKTLGKSHPDYASSLNNLAVLYYTQGLYGKAEPLLTEAKEIRLKILGKEHPDYAQSLNNLACLYQTQGLYSKVEPLYIEAKEVQLKILGKDHLDYATCLDNLATLYCNQGLYPKAEPLFIESKGVYLKLLSQEHPSYAQSLNNLALLYRDQGLYAKSEPLFIQAKEIQSKALGKENPVYAAALNNLALLYRDQGLYAKSEPLFTEAKEILLKIFGREHASYASSLNNLAGLYQAQGLYAEAESSFTEAKEIRLKILGKEHPDYANSLNNLAELYRHQGLYTRAESLYVEATHIRLKIFGKEHPEYANSLNGLAELYKEQNLYEQAQPLYAEVVQNKLHQVQTLFPSLSEKEKEQFYQSIRYFFEGFQDFSIKRVASHPSITADLYNLQLSTKALLLNTSLKMKHRILNSNDEALKEKFRQWQDKKELLTKTCQLSKAEVQKRGIDIARLEEEINGLEKELSLQSQAFASATDKILPTWKEVQQKLKNKEAAIEMIRIVIRKENRVKDTLYVALIVKHDTKAYPEMVILPEGSGMEGKYLNLYRNRIRFKMEDTVSYQKYWQQIAPALKGIKKVYFSADGVYNQLNLNILKNPKTGKYLADETEIHLVTNTRDVLKFDKEKPLQNTATLVGFPNYRMEAARRSDVAKTFNTTQGTVNATQLYAYQAPVVLERSGINDLPATRVEVEKIDEVLKTKKWQTNVYLQDAALEELIKSASSPRVLHIATHGFFQADVTKKENGENAKPLSSENPLLRSGLLLAGAAKTLQNGRDSLENTQTEDGILSAFEAMNLNLDHTDLVVLSACETGLGEVKNGEGVYGLQRAFIVAGAKSLIISLWKVDDAATQELMSSFYKYWTQKKDKRKAFYTAQKALREKYPDPYFWGAFVLVGK